MLTAFVLALVLARAADVAVITPDQAKDHVGQDVVVQGYVAQVGASEDGHTLFLNFGGRYPDHVFNAVIFSRNLQSLPEVRSWEGKVINVRGKIQLYKGKGKPEIVLERQDQVTIDPSTTPLQGAVPEGHRRRGRRGRPGRRPRELRHRASVRLRFPPPADQDHPAPVPAGGLRQEGRGDGHRRDPDRRAGTGRAGPGDPIGPAARRRGPADGLPVGVPARREARPARPHDRPRSDRLPDLYEEGSRSAGAAEAAAGEQPPVGDSGPHPAEPRATLRRAAPIRPGWRPGRACAGDWSHHGRAGGGRDPASRRHSLTRPIARCCWCGKSRH